MDLLVNIDVGDLNKAVDFYSAAFGLKVRRRFGDLGVELAGGSAAIFLLVKTEGTVATSTTAQKRTYARHWTPVHLDFVVDDIEASVHRAVEVGATLEDPIEEHRWGRIAHLADPFGHGFCLIQFLGRGYDEIAESSL